MKPSYLLFIVLVTLLSACSKKGCIDPIAVNYDEKAKKDDGTCVYVKGCMDNTATNYNAAATKDDGTCTYTGNGILKISIKPTYKGSAFSLNTNYIDSKGIHFNISLLKAYLSDIKVGNASVSYKMKDVIFYDLENPASLSFSASKRRKL